MRHDKELIIFLRIDSVTVNRSKPPLIGINETLVTCACGSELHLDLSVTLIFLCSCTQLLLSAELSGFFWLQFQTMFSQPSCQGRCNSCGSSACCPCFCPQLLYSAQLQLSQGCQVGWASGGMWKREQFRVGLCGKRSNSTEVPGAGQILFYMLHHCGLSSELREFTALRYEIPFSKSVMKTIF